MEGLLEAEGTGRGSTPCGVLSWDPAVHACAPERGRSGVDGPRAGSCWDPRFWDSGLPRGQWPSWVCPQLQVAQMRIEYLEQSTVDRAIVSRQEAVICDLENKTGFQKVQIKRFEVLVGV